MKKAIGLIISIILTMSLCACSWLQNLSYNAEVEKALAALEAGWTESYRTAEVGDGYVEIKNTRVIKLNEAGKAFLKDAESIVEFELFTDYLGTAPYYGDTDYMDTVVIYKDGTALLQGTNPLQVYRSNYFKLDIIEEVIDLGDAYNRTWDLE